MSITRGVLAQSQEPEAHEKVLDNNPDRIGISMMVMGVRIPTTDLLLPIFLNVLVSG